MKLHDLCMACVLGALLLALAGCSSETPTPVASVPPSASPVATVVPKTLIPRDHTPKPDLGIVQGVLTVNDQPAVDYTLYLAALISQGDQGGVAALDPVHDPRARSDASGYFVFLDVKPGQYALGINSPAGPILIRRDNDEIIVEVREGQIVDVGTVPIVPFGE